MKAIILLSSLFLSYPSFAKDTTQVVNMQVTDKGFEPAEIKVKPGSHVVLKVTRKTDSTCATQIKVNGKKGQTELPLNKEVTVDLGKLAKGDITYACGMDMITGHIIVQ